MSDDPRQFDDDLPDWLNSSGDNEEDQSSQPDEFADMSWLQEDDSDSEEGQTSQRTGLTGELSWLQEDDADTERGRTSQRTGLTGELPWLQEDDADSGEGSTSQRTGLTGELPWLQEDDADTGQGQPSQRTGVTGELPWLQSDEPPGKRTSQEIEEQLNWLDENSGPEQQSEAEAPAMPDISEEAVSPDIDAAMPDWLDDIDLLIDDDDDEDLAPDVSAGEPAVAQESVSDNLSDWLNEDTGTTEVPRTDAAQPTDDLPDWLDSIDAEDPFADAPAPSVEEVTPVQQNTPDWLNAAEFDDSEPDEAQPAPAQPADDLPDWLDSIDAEDPFADAAASQVEEAIPVQQDTPDWLDTDEFTPEPAEETAQPADELPDWLDNIDADTPSEEPVVEQSEAVPDWLESTGSLDDDEPADLDDIFDDDWLDEEAPATRQPAPSTTISEIRPLKSTQEVELTYEEWEQRQAEAEQEAQQAEAKRSEDEMMPDWFSELEGDGVPEEPATPSPPQPPSTPAQAEVAPPEIEAPEPVEESSTGPLDDNFVPDWFMGLEEQNLEEAPDWVKDATTGAVSSDSFMDLDVSSLAPPEPEAPSTSSLAGFDADLPSDSGDDDVPDWFKDVDLPASDTSAADSLSIEAPDFDFASPPDLDFDGPEAQPTDEAQSAVPPDFDFFSMDASALTEKAESPEVEVSEPDFFSMELPDSDEEAATSEPDLDFFSMDMADDDQTPAPAEAADTPDWLRDFDTDTGETTDTPEAPAFSLEPEMSQQSDDQSLDMGWLDNLDDSDFNAPEAPQTPFFEAEDAPVTTPEEKPLFDDREMRTLGRQSLDDLFGDSSEENSLLPVDIQRRKMTSDLMLPADEDNVETFPEDLFGGLDDDVLSAIESSPQQTGAPEDDFAAMLAEAEDIDDHFEDDSETDTEEESDDEIYLAQGAESWLEEIRPDTTINMNVGSIQIEVEQKRLADLPENIRRLRERSQKVAPESATQSQAPAPFSAEASSGLVAGGLTVNPLTITPDEGLTYQHELDISELHYKNADLLERLITLNAPAIEKQADTAQATKTKKHTRQLDRIVINVVLLVLLIGTFVTDALHFADDPDSDALATEQPVLIDNMDNLESGDYVLVVFEYGPTAAGELNPMAEAILRDIFQQGAIPLITSTHPLGSINARYVINTLSEDDTLSAVLPRNQSPSAQAIIEASPRLETCQKYIIDLNTPRLLEIFSRQTAQSVENARRMCDYLLVRLENGTRFERAFLVTYRNLPEGGTPQSTGITALQDYILLSYIPGNAVGVRALSDSQLFSRFVFEQDNRGRETGLEFDELDSQDIQMTLVLGETARDIRLWAEQFDVDDMPTFALVTAAAEPFARAYTGNNNAYDGYLSGHRDTLRYNQLRNSTARKPFESPDNMDVPDPEISQWQGISLGTLLAALIIGAGVLFNMIRTLRRRAG